MEDCITKNYFLPMKNNYIFYCIREENEVTFLEIIEHNVMLFHRVTFSA